MSTNPYFKSNFKGTADQTLVQSLIVEAIKMYGMDMYYIPRERVAFDELYGEDKLSAFTKPYLLEFYIDSAMGFGGDKELISKFGFEVRDELNLSVARVRFNSVVASQEPGVQHPREGDIIYLPLEKGLFEITFADEDEIFHQLGNLFTYALKLKRFEAGGETFNTGIDDIDNVMDNHMNTVTLALTAGTGDFTPGETVEQGSTASGEVVAWDSTSKQLVLLKVSGVFGSVGSIVGVTSGASWTYTPSDSDDLNQSTLNKDNKHIDAEAQDGVVDFSESNPYGEQ